MDESALTSGHRFTSVVFDVLISTDKRAIAIVNVIIKSVAHH